jgi:hypothetical protein
MYPVITAQSCASEPMKTYIIARKNSTIGKTKAILFLSGNRMWYLHNSSRYWSYTFEQ